MRLLNTQTFEFGEFYDHDIPPYAILSHRWRQDEVSYGDFLAGRKRNGAGYAKIIRACGLAASESQKEGAEYGPWIWIDTCCINQASSTELSEAINSMWRWYKNAVVCYAFLDDVPDNLEYIQDLRGLQRIARSSEMTETLRASGNRFQRSEWFTRGWTLQELLAPARVEFLGQSWTKIGNKVDLCTLISWTTGIRSDIIGCPHLEYGIGAEISAIDLCSAAEKLSWAANRRTSRMEDMAYCLLGILGVNMPLMYGEGKNAFVRLQEELLRSGDDESIFAWSAFSEPRDAFKTAPLGHFRRKDNLIQNIEIYPYLFADTPQRFASCANVKKSIIYDREPSFMTNRGLRMDVSLIPLLDQAAEFVVPLNCVVENPEAGETRPLALQLILVDRERNLYNRKGCLDLGQPELVDTRSLMEQTQLMRGALGGTKPLHIPRLDPAPALTVSFVLSLVVHWALKSSSWRSLSFVNFILFPSWFWLTRREKELILISKEPISSSSFGRIQIQEIASIRTIFENLKRLLREWRSRSWIRYLPVEHLIMICVALIWVLAITKAQNDE